MKLKTIHVDFNDSTLGTIAREGEHNRTQLVFTLDEDLQACDFINVEFGIEDSEEKIILENLCPEEGETTLTVALPQAVTVRGMLTIQLVGYVIDSDTAEPLIIAKSPVVGGDVTPSINGVKKIAETAAGLLDRILAKVNDLAVKAHTHRNLKTLEKLYCELAELESGDGLTIAPDYEGVDRLKFANKYLRYCVDGSVITNKEEVKDEDGNVIAFRIYLSGRGLGTAEECFDIPVTGITKSQVQLTPDITINSSQLNLGVGEGSGGIQAVTSLPETANEGDVVYYCPPPNRLTAVDSNHKVYVDMNKVERLVAYYNAHPGLNGNIFNIPLNDTGESLGFEFNNDIFSYFYQEPQTESTENLYFDSAWFGGAFDPFNSEVASANDYIIRCYNVQPIQCYTITTVDESHMNTVDPSIDDLPVELSEIFYVTPRYYRYINGEWVELPYTEPELPNEVECTLTDTSLTYGIMPNILYQFDEVDMLNIYLLNGEADRLNEYKFSFVSGETATVLTLPSSVKWVNELTVESNKRYEISVVDNVALWCAVDYEVTE